MAPCPASAQLLQGTRAWGSTCSDPWSPIWPCSLLPKNIPAQTPSSVALAQPSTAQTPQSGASFLTWLLPKPFHNFCHVFLPHTPPFRSRPLLTLWPSAFLSGSLGRCQESVDTIQKHHQNHTAATASPCARLGIFPFLPIFLLFLPLSPLRSHVAPRLVILGWVTYPSGLQATPHPGTPVCWPPGRLSMGAVGLCHLPA